MKQKRKIAVTPDKYKLNSEPDLPDIRDWPYEPTLATLKSSIAPPSNLTILDQEQEGACTGFGLAAVINLLNKKRKKKILVSPRMLYEMAKRHDEWPGEEYAGSSCRGAIKGWFHMGVCTSDDWKYEPNKPGSLTIKRIEGAKKNTVGAYYRLQPRVSDFHAALNEAGAVYCSARVHRGWFNPDKKNGEIPVEQETVGGHAFAIIGYNAKGFWIQNSWSDKWGKMGLGLWRYEDWLVNMMDAWVVGLALPTPQIWFLPSTSERNRSRFFKPVGPPRSEIAGHFVHLDDGRFHTQGKYWSDLNDVKITAHNIAASDQYDHLLLYAHGGLNSPTASAKRIAAMKNTFLNNRVYPYHFMYDTGLLEEIKDVILRREDGVEKRVEGFTDYSDRLVEIATRIPGRALWREMKKGAREPFRQGRDGDLSLQTFIKELSGTKAPKMKIHLAGHSTGGILLAWLLEALGQQGVSVRISSCSLLAPACSVDLFRKNYLPLLAGAGTSFGIDQLQVFCLNDSLEQDDQVAQVYRKSLLYLVSRAFEEDPPEKILGMETYINRLQKTKKIKKLGGKVKWYVSDGQPSDPTASTSHGGFDNDPATMNTILRAILGKKPDVLFTRESLAY